MAMSDLELLKLVDTIKERQRGPKGERRRWHRFNRAIRRPIVHAATDRWIVQKD